MTWFITPAAAQTAPAHTPDASHAADPTAGVHSEVAHDAGGHDAGFPPFDPTYFASQIFWLAITFGLLYWLVSKKAAPRIGGILEARRDRIQGDLGEAERARAETDAAIAAYEQALAEARQKAGTIATQNREKVARELDARRHAVEADLAARLSKAETEIGAIKAKALADVDAIATETTEAIVGALIGQASTDEAASAVAAVRQG